MNTASPGVAAALPPPPARPPDTRVYVAHAATGVRRVPAEWLPSFESSGFRRATENEIAAYTMALHYRD